MLRKKTSDTMSGANACTDWTTPERVMNVPRMTSANVNAAIMTAQRLKPSRRR